MQVFNYAWRKKCWLRCCGKHRSHIDDVVLQLHIISVHFVSCDFCLVVANQITMKESNWTNSFISIKWNKCSRKIPFNLVRKTIRVGYCELSFVSYSCNASDTGWYSNQFLTLGTWEQLNFNWSKMTFHMTHLQMHGRNIYKYKKEAWICIYLLQVFLCFQCVSFGYIFVLLLYWSGFLRTVISNSLVVQSVDLKFYSTASMD